MVQRLLIFWILVFGCLCFLCLCFPWVSSFLSLCVWLPIWSFFVVSSLSPSCVSANQLPAFPHLLSALFFSLCWGSWCYFVCGGCLVFPPSFSCLFLFPWVFGFGFTCMSLIMYIWFVSIFLGLVIKDTLGLMHEMKQIRRPYFDIPCWSLALHGQRS